MKDKIRDYIEKAQEDAGFLNFYFLSADGNYKMLTGETGISWIYRKILKMRSDRGMIS